MDVNRARTAFGRCRPWQELVRICLSQLDGLAGNANAGIVFMADPTGEMVDDILFHLKAETGIERWIGAAGRGVISGANEAFDEPGLALMLIRWPDSDIRLIETGGVIPEDRDGLALLHLASDTRFEPLPHGAVGGRVSTVFDGTEIAGVATAGGCSGLWFGPRIAHATAILRGGRANGPWRRVSSAIGGRILLIDDRSAADAVAADAGELLARAPERLIRSIMIETCSGEEEPGASGRPLRIEQFSRASGEVLVQSQRPGNWLRVTNRNPAIALEEIDSAVGELLDSFPGARKPRAAILYGSVDRGHALFGPAVSEASRVQAALGSVPLIGLRTSEELHGGELACGTAVLALIG